MGSESEALAAEGAVLTTNPDPGIQGEVGGVPPPSLNPLAIHLVKKKARRDAERESFVSNDSGRIPLLPGIDEFQMKSIDLLKPQRSIYVKKWRFQADFTLWPKFVRSPVPCPQLAADVLQQLLAKCHAELPLSFFFFFFLWC